MSTCVLAVGICLGMIHNKIARRRRTSGDRIHSPFGAAAAADEEEDAMNVDLDSSASDGDADTLQETTV